METGGYVFFGVISVLMVLIWLGCRRIKREEGERALKREIEYIDQDFSEGKISKEEVQRRLRELGQREDRG